jgi:1,4-alpha-glucan branching enzyme
MGQEFGQESEWAESRQLDWWLLDHPEHLGLQDLVRHLNLTYRGTPALYAGDDSAASFEWIDADDAGRNVYSFVRRSAGEPDLACVANFSAVPHDGYVLRLPSDGVWEEIVNTDAHDYGGSGVGNLGSVTASDGSATIVVPPLATLWLRRRPEPTVQPTDEAADLVAEPVPGGTDAVVAPGRIGEPVVEPRTTSR